MPKTRRVHLPSIGQISLLSTGRLARRAGDDGIETGAHVTPFYDPMLAKVITSVSDRRRRFARWKRRCAIRLFPA
ncbi:MAG: hypothetical protein IPJ94_19700 [Chloroflexi bacterium]|nr:hypothetical protein [Chloroflexota bacterium]